MEVDDKVMPHAGNTEGNESGVVVPRGEGADHIKVKEREGLAELPVAPVNGPEEGTAKGDALMEEVEDAKEEQKANAEDDGAAADEDDDDLFGCVGCMLRHFAATFSCMEHSKLKCTTKTVMRARTMKKNKTRSQRRDRTLQLLHPAKSEMATTFRKPSLNGGDALNTKKRMHLPLRNKK